MLFDDAGVAWDIARLAGRRTGPSWIGQPDASPGLEGTILCASRRLRLTLPIDDIVPRGWRVGLFGVSSHFANRHAPAPTVAAADISCSFGEAWGRNRLPGTCRVTQQSQEGVDHRALPLSYVSVAILPM